MCESSQRTAILHVPDDTRPIEKGNHQTIHIIFSIINNGSVVISTWKNVHPHPHKPQANYLTTNYLNSTVQRSTLSDLG